MIASRRAFSARPLRRIDLDLEHGILHPLAEIAAGLGDPPQPPCAAALGRPHVVGHENQQRALSLPEPRRIGVEVAAQMAGEQLRLQVGNEAERRDFVEERMAPLVRFALLPGRKHRLAAVVGRAGPRRCPV